MPGRPVFLLIAAGSGTVALLGGVGVGALMGSGGHVSTLTAAPATPTPEVTTSLDIPVLTVSAEPTSARPLTSSASPSASPSPSVSLLVSSSPAPPTTAAKQTAATVPVPAGTTPAQSFGSTAGCDVSMFMQTESTDRGSYATGTTVTATLTITWHRSAACTLTETASTGYSTFRDSGGAVVHDGNPCAAGHACPTYATQKTFQPGTTQSFTTSWNQTEDSGTTAPAGSYSAVGMLGGANPSAAFTLSG